MTLLLSRWPLVSFSLEPLLSFSFALFVAELSVLKNWSSGAKKTMKEEALDSLKTMGSASIDGKKPPSPVQAFLGAISAGVISLVLYKFTTTIEAALNGQTMADNFSEIINVLCYLARFVNSVGLFLYSAQLAFNSFMEGSTREKSESEGNE
ncbi:uncharacterized protein LOC131176571 isoform X3 [Hevea brasiliensis]|uniref:uncharacterized protein LOC131176571 isoform X3 n=1 Tax=Hevea brasiliensis TaxID=3981 RepID=UPI0025E3F6AB|nr:uncharacterized protein LOC131176571 isoform X3 [Hevea brasiliensis]